MAKVRFKGRDTLKTVLYNLLLLALGSCFSALAANGVLKPLGFLSGGFIGLSLSIYYLAPFLDLALIYIVLNLPLFFFGYRLVGRRFFFYSAIGTIFLTLALEFIHFEFDIPEKLLAALFGGILNGIGAGLMLRSLGSGGGTDMLSVILYTRKSIRLGTTILVFNTLVLACAALLFSLQAALYTLVCIFVTVKVTELMVMGFSQRHAVLIVSQFWRDISQGIISEMHRGVTILKGQGAYSGEDENVLYTVVGVYELGRLKGLIRRHDQNAFVVVSDTLEVQGHRIGNQPNWSDPAALVRAIKPNPKKPADGEHPVELISVDPEHKDKPGDDLNA